MHTYIKLKEERGPPNTLLPIVQTQSTLERERYPSTKSIDCSPPNTMRSRWPIHHLGGNTDFLEVDLGIWVEKVHLGRYLAPFQALNCLDDACQCGTSFKVADIAFDRSYYEWLISVSRLKDRIDGRKF